MAISRFYFDDRERQWYNNLLRTRNLDAPTGAPIYTYRISATEYAQLKQILAERCRTQDISDLLNQLGFQTLFIAFASEWWKREYAGGPWKWENIFSAIGTNKPTNWAQNTAQIITAGLRTWRLALQSDDGHKYFGAIVANGGLPANHLQDPTNSSNIRQLIHACLTYKIQYVVSTETLKQHLLNHPCVPRLPACMQCDEIYDMLLNIVLTIVALKEQYNLHSKSNAIERLDSANPHWRDALPILLEDHSVKVLFDSLLCDATEIRAQGKKPYATRILKNGKLTLQITFPERVESDYFRAYFEIKNTDDLPSKFDITTWDDNPVCIASVRRSIFKSNEFDIIEHTPTVEITQSVILQLYSANCGAFSNPTRIADAIDPTQPMIFLKNPQGEYTYYTSGTAYLSQPECAIAVPESDELNNTLCNFEKISNFSVSDTTFNLYKCTSDIELGEYEIKLNMSVPSHQYILGGHLFPYKTRPYETYCGAPKLYCIDAENNTIEIHKFTFMRHRTNIPLAGNEQTGLVDVCYIQDGRQMCRLPAFILPLDAKIKYHAGQSITNGQITFENFYNFDITPYTSPLYTANMSNNTTATVSATGTTPPATVSFRVQDASGHINFAVPFPVSGAAFYNDNGECINSHIISLNSIYGKRIKIFNFASKMNHCTIRLSNTAQTTERAIRINDAFIWSSLSDFESDIRFLLPSNPNHNVRISVDVGGNNPYLIVYNYDAELINDNTGLTLCVNTSTQISPSTAIHAINISTPGSGVINIPFNENGQLDLSGLESTPGTYIIFSPKTSNLSLQPILWQIGAAAPTGSLFDMMSKTTSEQTDFLKSNLRDNYNSAIWDEISYIADVFIEHSIPFSSMKMWRCITSDPELLCAFLFRIKSLKINYSDDMNITDRFEYAQIFLSVQHHRPKQTLLHAIRNQLHTHVSLIPYRTLIQTATHYKNYLLSDLHRDFTDYIHNTYPSSTWTYMEKKYDSELTHIYNHMLALCYNAITSVFSEIQYTLATSLFDETQAGEIIAAHHSNPVFEKLTTNLMIWGAPDKHRSKSEHLKKISDQAFTLSSQLSPNGRYKGVSIQLENQLTSLAQTCYQACPTSVFTDFMAYYNSLVPTTSHPSLTGYKQSKTAIANAGTLAEHRRSVQFFPIFCAILSHCDLDDNCLNTPEYHHAVRSFMNFNSDYFVETYKNATIILSKSE